MRLVDTEMCSSVLGVLTAFLFEIVCQSEQQFHVSGTVDVSLPKA
jgi:hypothetical protein